jgi:hypothetical protein
MLVVSYVKGCSKLSLGSECVYAQNVNVMELQINLLTSLNENFIQIHKRETCSPGSQEMTVADEQFSNHIHVKTIHLVRASFSSPFKSFASKSNTREKLPFEALWTSNTCREKQYINI